jgi:hypothetical protein
MRPNLAVNTDAPRARLRPRNGPPVTQAAMAKVPNARISSEMSWRQIARAFDGLQVAIPALDIRNVRHYVNECLERRAP